MCKSDFQMTVPYCPFGLRRSRKYVSIKTGGAKSSGSYVCACGNPSRQKPMNLTTVSQSAAITITLRQHIYGGGPAKASDLLPYSPDRQR